MRSLDPQVDNFSRQSRGTVQQWKGTAHLHATVVQSQVFLCVKQCHYIHPLAAITVLSLKNPSLHPLETLTVLELLPDGGPSLYLHDEITGKLWCVLKTSKNKLQIRTYMPNSKQLPPLTGIAFTSVFFSKLLSKLSKFRVVFDFENLTQTRFLS